MNEQTVLPHCDCGAQPGPVFAGEYTARLRLHHSPQGHVRITAPAVLSTFIGPGLHGDRFHCPWCGPAGRVRPPWD